jgi:hypothetical protein
MPQFYLTYAGTDVVKRIPLAPFLVGSLTQQFMLK